MLVKKNQNQFIFWITASCLIFTLAVILFTPFTVSYAATTQSDIISNLDTVAAQTPLQKADLLQTVGKIIKIFLDVLGIIFLCIVLYAGYLYMTSGGDPEKTKTAKAWIINAVIGLIIIFLSYSIVAFVFNALKENIGEGTYNITSTIPKGLGYNLSGSSFGEILSGHSPYPEQAEVPRNTMIVVTFKLPIDPTSFIDLTAPDVTTGTTIGYDVCPDALAKCKTGDCPETASVCGPVDKNAFKTYRCDKMAGWPTTTPLKSPSDCVDATIADPANINDVVPGFVMITQDRRTVVFNPFGNGKTTDDYLGSSEENVSYIVHLVGPPPAGAGIRKLEPVGTSVFSVPTSGLSGYSWRFTTGTFVDLTPPKVTLTIPKDQVGIDTDAIDGSLCDPEKDFNCPIAKVFRNQIVVANFNEPVLPLFSTDQTGCVANNTSNEAQLLIADGTKATGCAGTSHVPGNWITGINQYRTIQFLSTMECEGVTENSCGEKVFCLPADKDLNGLLKAAKITAEIAEIGTGIVDLAGNSLDGSGDGKADGQPADDFEWSFGVGHAIDLAPPAIQELLPRNNAQSVDKSVPIKVIFNKDLDAASVDTQIFLSGAGFANWFDPNIEAVDVDPVTQLPIPSMNIVNMSHGPFTEVNEGEEGPLYMPVIKAQLRDMRQNCFTPSRNVVPAENSAYELTSPTAIPESTATDCNDIGDKEYGKSCCPNVLTHKPTLDPLGGECAEPWGAEE
ncbi:MAG: hypothetical protein UT32_C0008G0014 [Parcubacteria group bacterium GW2011_GWC2_39_14]|nr:MAG: hypothetical protein UT32_C0008G0014 [Parcubacteria group bacterium GW2011_GWC2_39_14]KKR54921.1 MAG: hypothetical protein UT91_C0007G0022 [Parcubacteria group bacterium GW2011_GWA2_40_23]